VEGRCPFTIVVSTGRCPVLVLAPLWGFGNIAPFVALCWCLRHFGADCGVLTRWYHFRTKNQHNRPIFATMNHVQQRLNAMNDFQVLRFFDFFSQQIFQGSQVELADLMGSLPASAQLSPLMMATTRLDDPTAGTVLTKQESAQVSRVVLQYWAENAPFDALLEAALSQYKETEQAADTILAVGAALSMVLFSLSQGGFQLSAFGMTVTLGQVASAKSAEFVQQVADTMPQALQNVLALAPSGQITDLLRAGKLEEALQRLVSQGNDSNAALHLQSRYAHWKNDRALGQHPSKDYEQREYLRILHAAISLIS
jgi:hypothetical protein